MHTSLRVFVRRRFTFCSQGFLSGTVFIGLLSLGLGHVACADGTALPPAFVNIPLAQPVKAGALEKQMAALVLPSCSFMDATLEEALEYLRISRGCLDMGDATTFLPISIVQERLTPEKVAITLDLKDVPLGDALRYVAELSGCELRYEAHAVVVGAIIDCRRSELLTRRYKVSPNFASDAARAKDPKAALLAAAVIHYEPQVPQEYRQAEQARYIAATQELEVKISSDRFNKLEEWLVGINAWAPPADPAAAQRAAKLIMPQISFVGASMDEVCAYLRAKTRELVPDGQGIELIYKPSQEVLPLITLELKQVPSLDVLRYIAIQTGCKLQASESALLLVGP
jgi:hypothetical protein